MGYKHEEKLSELHCRQNFTRWRETNEALSTFSVRPTYRVIVI